MKKGFSLVEAVISVTVLLIGVISITSLGVAMLTQARLTNKTVVANQLAREGIEVVRSVRDGNWLLSEDGMLVDFRADLSSKNDYTAVPEWDSTSNIWVMDFLPFEFGDCGTGFDCTRIYQRLNPPYEYAQFVASPGADWEETPYQRLLYLFPICRSTTDELTEAPLTVDYTDCGATQEVVGIDIQVHMQWVDNGQTKTTMLQEYVYDWKY